MSKKHKVAFIGGGINSAVGNVHRSAIELDQKFQLVAGCFSNLPDQNKLSADKYRVSQSRSYDSPLELITSESNELDAAVILTPTPNHKEDVLLCMQYGVPVICEKALASSLDEIKEIHNLQHKTKTYLTVTYNYTGYPMVRELREQVQSGNLGDIHQLLVEMPQDSFLKVDADSQKIVPQEWRQLDNDIPTVSLDLGVHTLQLVDFLLGKKPEKVVAIENHTGNIKNVIDNINCILRYGETTANMWYGKTALGHRNGLRIRIYGSKGSAEWYQMDPEHVYCANQQGTRYIMDRSVKESCIASQERYNRFKAGHPAGFIEAFANLYSDISNDLLHISESNYKCLSEYTFGIKSAERDMKTLNAIHESARSSQWISINEH